MNEFEEIEFWENHYLNQIEFTLIQDQEKMLEGLRSKDKIKDDWIKIFHKRDKNAQNSDFSRGAERIFYWLFDQFGIPNSSPIGADMFFELYNAFIHIDIKTAKINNHSDYKGKIPIGENQTSYKPDNCFYTANLPVRYSYKNKICLTYFINIIYDITNENIEIKAIILISVPNGKLKSVYNDRIVDAGKSGSKGKGFRYVFANKPQFQLLKDQNTPLRVKIIYTSPDISADINEIINLKTT